LPPSPVKAQAIAAFADENLDRHGVLYR